jgi:hypothetical protein
MDHAILLHFGGSITEQFELVGMRCDVLTFSNRPSFNNLIAGVRTVINVGCDVWLYGRYDMNDNRPIYVMLPLWSEDEWLLYKCCASQSGLKSAEVVAEIAPLPDDEITVRETGVTIEEILVDPIAVQQASQEEWLHGTHRVSLGNELAKAKSEALNRAVVTYHFDDETFDENVDTGHTLKKMMKHQSARAMKKTCNLQVTQLPMHRSTYLMKVMSKMCPNQQLINVMF